MQPIQIIKPLSPKKHKKVIVVISLVVLLAGLLAGAAIWFNGGVRPIFDDFLPTPDPTSEKLGKKREASKNSTTNEFGAIENSMGFTSGSASTYDSCYKGQNNYKVHSGFSNRCTLRTTKYYGSNINFRSEMMKLDQVLVSTGWQSSEKDSLPYYMTDYYDTGRKISQLPQVRGGYTKKDNTIAISYAEKGSNSLYNLETVQGFSLIGFPFYEEKKFQDVASVFNQITANNQFIVAISIDTKYYEN
ncbi:MAG: hypothetical protein WCJ60_01975 [bacterium]